MTKNKKILVIDDDQGIVDAMKIMLEEFGFEVETVTNGKTFSIILQSQPRLVLLDIWMSGIDGKDVCKQLKADQRTKHIPIILISANKDVEPIAKESGANDFLAKPFQMDELVQMVKKYLK